MSVLVETKVMGRRMCNGYTKMLGAYVLKGWELTWWHTLTLFCRTTHTPASKDT